MHQWKTEIPNKKELLPSKTSRLFWSVQEKRAHKRNYIKNE